MIGTVEAATSAVEVGESTNLSWSGIENADWAEIDHGIGEVALAGGQATVAPAETTVYTLTAHCGPQETKKEVTVSVKEPLKVESVTASVSPASKTTTACSTPYPFKFTGKIKASRDGTVTYQWERSDGTLGDKKSLVFSAADTKTVTDTWTAAIGTSGWERLKVLTPEAKTSGKASFTSACQFAVTKVTADFSPRNFDGYCAGEEVAVTLKGAITTNKAGTVKYTWAGTLSVNGPTVPLPTLPIFTVNFTGAGTKSVSFPTTEFTIDPGTYIWSLYLKVTSPNAIKSATETGTHTFIGCPT